MLISAIRFRKSSRLFNVVLKAVVAPARWCFPELSGHHRTRQYSPTGWRSAKRLTVYRDCSNEPPENLAAVAAEDDLQNNDCC